MCQVSRFDPWKDPVGVIEAFRIVRERVPDAQLVLAGSMATDDPEGFQVWDDTEAARAGDRDIYLLSNLHQVGSVQINAFQRIAEVVLQKSLREGFGLTVSEGLWKGRPVIGGRAGGIKLQIRDGFDGYLVDSVEECAQRTIDLLADPVGADALGAQGQRARARELPLDARARRLADPLRDAAQVMLVTHRGPYRFSVRDDGSFAPQRGAGGLVSALLPLVQRDDIGERPSWVAAAIDDDDRAAVAAGAATVPGLDLHLLDLDPALHRMHYDVISNAVLWFLHHGLFDLARRPRFDRHLREAWDGYVAVNAAFADVVVRSAPEREQVLVHDYHLALVPGMVRAARPDLRLTHFTHTPFCGPNSIRVLPTDMAEAMCASMGAVPSGSTPQRWAAAYAASAREVLGPRRHAAPYATPLGPDPDAAGRARRLATPPRRAAAELDELVGDRKLLLRSDRIDLSKNIVRGFHVYDALLDTHPEWRERVVFVAMLNRSRSNLAEYLAYEQEVDQAAARVNERWAHARLAAGRGRHARRLRADHRRVHPLRRAAGEPGEGRPEPRGQGGSAASTGATAWCCSHPKRARTTSCTTRCCPCTRTTSNRARTRCTPRWSMPDDERAARATAPVRARRRAHAAHLARRAAQPRALSASASASSSAASPAGPSTTTSAAWISGGLSSDVTPMLTACASVAVADERAQGGERGQVAGVVAGERGARRMPRARSATVVPLSTGTGGRSSTAMRPRSGASSPRRGAASAAHAVASRAPLGLVAPVDGDRHLALALHPQPGQRGLGLVGRLRDRVDERPHPLVEHHLAGDDPFEAVGADVVEPVDRQRVAQERGGPTAHDRHRAEHAGRAAPARRAPRGAAAPRPGRARSATASRRSRRTARRVRARATNGRSARGTATVPPRRALRGADDDDAVGVGRALGRVGRVRLRSSHRCRRRTARAACPHARTRRRTATTVPWRSLVEVGRRLHVVALGARAVSVRVCARALHARRVVDLHPHLVVGSAAASWSSSPRWWRRAGHAW